MAVFNNILAGASGQTGGAAAADFKSLRFNPSDSSYLSRTPSSSGNRRTFTTSMWLKRSGPVNCGVLGQELFRAGNSALSAMNFAPSDGPCDGLSFKADQGGVSPGSNTNAVFRDFSAWMHIVYRIDTTQATAADRVRIYVNNVQQSWYAANYPSQNQELKFNQSGQPHYIGGLEYLNGYLAQFAHIDGSSLAPSSFAEYDTNNVWVPKADLTAESLSFGTNGFLLTFADNSSASALGTDTSGNGNDWTVNNIVANADQYIPYVFTDTGSSTTYNSSANSSNYYSGSSPANGFDGSTGTFAGGEDVGGSWVYFRPATSITGVTSLRVYSSYCYQIYVNGSNAVTPNTTTAQWHTISSPPSTITEIAVQGMSSQGAAGRFSAIEVNSSTLIDYAGKDNDSLFDSPTNGTQTDTGAGGEVSGNYATLNPLAKTGATTTLSNGNLEATGDRNSYATIALPASGKWYWEVTPTAGSYPMIGVAEYVATSTASYTNTSMFYYGVNGDKYNAGSNSSYGATYTTNDVIGVAVDIGGGTVTFYKNGSSQGSITYDATGLFPASTTAGGSATYTFNFGQRPFAYTAPTGYQPLTTALLDDPTIADGSTAMDVALYTGNFGSKTISGLNTSPDLVWIKTRGPYSGDHNLFDAVRGTGNRLRSNTTNAEDAYGGLTAFNSDGFTLEAKGAVNGSSETYAAWCWDGGSSTVSNTDGSITSSVRANASAGFSIVGYTGNATTGATIGHGLGAIPKLVIIKDRTNGTDWEVWHGSLSNTSDGLILNGTDAVTSRNRFDVTGFTSTVFKIGSTLNNVNYSSSFNYIAYCWAPVEGYSAFGSYTGNGSSDGPFVYTGFRPRWILTKRTDTSGQHWGIFDNRRDGYNSANDELLANLSAAEASTLPMDILSNGFKIRNTAPDANGSGGTFIYAAFASHPFKTSRAR